MHLLPDLEQQQNRWIADRLWKGSLRFKFVRLTYWIACPYTFSLRPISKSLESNPLSFRALPVTIFGNVISLFVNHSGKMWSFQQMEEVMSDKHGRKTSSRRLFTEHINETTLEYRNHRKLSNGVSLVKGRPLCNWTTFEEHLGVVCLAKAGWGTMKRSLKYLLHSPFR